MSDKMKKIYVCKKCDAQFSKWNGRCLECGGWGTLEEKSLTEKEIKGSHQGISPAEIIDFSKIKIEKAQRLITKIDEFDRVVGGGIMPGSLVLLSGEPGIGKSTIVAQVANIISQQNQSQSVIYISGEESSPQLRSRFSRLQCHIEKIAFITEVNVEKIVSAIEKINPKLIIVDSIQTLNSLEAESETGSITQIRACTAKLLEVAKRLNIAIILVGHVTKDGVLAGPKSLEHLVDTVVYLETESVHNFRILRATKNRFGSVNEIGIFEMTGQGFKEIKNPSSVFVDIDNEQISGSVISCVIEGTRPFLVEIQALVTKTVFGYPQRKSSGFDLNRLQVLTAVLTKRANINLTNQDVILNIVGGMRINDPALDLAVCLAIVSSLLNQTISRKTIALGEVGLGGEIRNIPKLEERIKEAEKLGFEKAIISNTQTKSTKIEIVKIKNLSEAINFIAHSS